MRELTLPTVALLLGILLVSGCIGGEYGETGEGAPDYAERGGTEGEIGSPDTEETGKDESEGGPETPDEVISHEPEPEPEQEEPEPEPEPEEECIPEGSSGVVIPDRPGCCPGLTSISCNAPDETGACDYCDGKFYCTNCGDEICTVPENECNCPEDCEVEEPEPEPEPQEPAELSLKTHKTSFEEGEIVEAWIETSADILTDYHPFSVYQLVGGEWQILSVFMTCPYMCPPEPTDSCDIPLPSCNINPNFCFDFDPAAKKFEWDQKVYIRNTIDCSSGSSFRCYTREPLSAGTYKVAFRYSEACANPTYFEDESNNPQEISKEFEITAASGAIAPCSYVFTTTADYTGLLTGFYDEEDGITGFPVLTISALSGGYYYGTYGCGGGFLGNDVVVMDIVYDGTNLPDEGLMLASIIDYDPFLKVYQCKNPSAQYGYIYPEAELLEILSNGELGSKCARLK